jgi:hypothetical protein
MFALEGEVMTAKMSERRRAAFLAALEASGNQTLAAEKACVSRSWVCKERSLNPEFDAKVRALIAAADARLRGGAGNAPPRGWGHLDGVELVVRGTNGRRLQIARARAGQWTARTEGRFLEVLGATCNAKAAYAAAGKSKGSAYGHRRRWAGFERRWLDVLDAGTDMLEERLMLRAENIFAEPEPPLPEPPELPAMTVAEAIHLLHLQRRRMLQIGDPPGAWKRPRSLAEVQDSIIRKLSALARRRGLA